MPKKLTYEFVKESFESSYYTLLSKEYINSSTKLNYICSKGHNHSVTWHDWADNHRCPYCLNNAKPKFCDVKESFEKENYVLLSKEYVNSVTKLDYICPKGHKHSITWSDWRTGYRCYHCAITAKLTLDKIKESFERENYTLLSSEYKNSGSKLHYICPKNHIHSITWNSWKSGCRCYYCLGTIKVKFSEVKEQFEKEGYKLLSKEYKNAHDKLYYICSNGHKHSIKWNDWKTGYRCPTCAIIKHTGSGNPNWKGGLSYEPYCEVWKDKEYKKDIKLRDNYRCLNPYCDSKNSNDLVIHHIDYDKKNCGPTNLITVCRSCNNKANKDRDWHKSWYQAIIKNRYYSRSSK